jgi:hypothetical protein
MKNSRKFKTETKRHGRVQQLPLHFARLILNKTKFQKTIKSFFKNAATKLNLNTIKTN